MNPTEIAARAHDAKNLLLDQLRFAVSAGQEAEGQIEQQLLIAMNFLDEVTAQAAAGALTEDIVREGDAFAKSLDAVPQDKREPAFKCVDNYKTCKVEAKTLEDKILCGIALVVCFAKEVVPLAKGFSRSEPTTGSEPTLGA